MNASKKNIIAYKFHKYNIHLIELLTKNSFHCSNQSELNDPFDGRIELTKTFLLNFFEKTGTWRINSPVLIWDNFLEKYDESGFVQVDQELNRVVYDSTESKVNFILETRDRKELFTKILMDEYDFRIISFVKGIDKTFEKLMWAHYTNGFEGVRLRFRFRNPLTKDWLQFFNIREMQYDKKPKINSEANIIDYFHYKYKEWSYEQEIRILIRHENKLGFKKSYLKEIVFGNKLKPNEIHLLICLCESLKYKSKYFKLIYKSGRFIKKEINNNEVMEILKYRGKDPFIINI